MRFEALLGRRPQQTKTTTESMPIRRPLTADEHCAVILTCLASASQVPANATQVLERAENHAREIAKGSDAVHTQARRYLAKVLMNDFSSKNPTFFAYHAAIMVNASISQKKLEAANPNIDLI